LVWPHNGTSQIDAQILEEITPTEQGQE
jgi:hypothetical protein